MATVTDWADTPAKHPPLLDRLQNGVPVSLQVFSLLDHKGFELVDGKAAEEPLVCRFIPGWTATLAEIALDPNTDSDAGDA